MRSVEPLAESAPGTPACPPDPLESGRLHLELAAPLRSLTRCRVCGFSEVETDEVAFRGTLILAECPRCEHRWTHPAGAAPRALGARVWRVPSPDAAEAAAAA